MLVKVHAAQLCRTRRQPTPPPYCGYGRIATFPGIPPLWWVDVNQSNETNSPVGCIWLGQATDQRQGVVHPYVLLLYVDPGHRRRGIATALLNTAHHWARSEGAGQISLQVFSDNAPAQALYEKLGYQPEAILMKKALE